jgi:hypothetical protein
MGTRPAVADTVDLDGWCWKKVDPLLREAGHSVVTPTLTGLGERAHLLTRDIGLDTHIADIVGLLEFRKTYAMWFWSGTATAGWS